MKNDLDHIRTFIAIPLPEEIKAFLASLQINLQKAGIKGSWPAPATMHLTLKFIGDTDIRHLDSIRAGMKKALSGIPVHTLSASGIGVFPSIKNTRVIWSGTRGQTDIIEKLANRLDKTFFKEFGIQKEKKRYSPHLTLARVKKSIPPKKMIKLIQDFTHFRSKDFLCSEIILFRSKLSSSGAVHKKIFSLPF